MIEAVDYYNEQCPGLGYEFAAEVQRTFERIASHPKAWTMFSARTQRCLVDRFPFGVLYQIRDDIILAGAIMHLKRYPRKWLDRIEELFGKHP